MAKGKGGGKPCGASHISTSKVCRVSMPPEIQKALNAAAGEVGAKTLKDAVQKHAGGKGVARLREIRADIKNEMGGNVVRGARADEMKKRLQAEGLLPNGKAKSEAPDINKSLKLEWVKLDKEQNKLQKELDSLVKGRDKTKPDPLYGNWDTNDMKQFRDGMIKRDPEKYKGAIDRINGELARREKLAVKQVPSNLKKELADLAAKDPQVPAKKGRTTLENEDLSRILRGESPKYMNVVDASGEAGAGARMKSKSQVAQLQSALGLGPQTRKEVGRDLEGLVDEAVAKRNRLKFDIIGKTGEERGKMEKEIDVLQKAIDGPKTAASTGTKYARENARDFDNRIRTEQLRRDGDKTFDRWDETTGTGAKKLGSGAYGTVIRTGDKSYAVKRGDLSDTEARLIQKLGDADLGPKLIAADIDGPGRMSNPGVDVRNGRLAMSIVPGSPIGGKAPDKTVGGVRVADAYWTARAQLHRMGVAHNDMHIDNVLIDRKGKGRFVDMGLAQESPRAALAEALGAFDPPKGASATRVMGAAGQGDWQVRRWNGTAGTLLARASMGEKYRKELEEKAPVAARVYDNKNELQYRMRKDGFSNDDIASVMDHGLRSPMSTYNKGVWEKINDQQAQEYINILYEGI